MKTTKYILTVKIEALSLDAVQYLLSRVRGQFGMSKKLTHGKLTSDDVDRVEWNVKQESVEL